MAWPLETPVHPRQVMLDMINSFLYQDPAVSSGYFAAHTKHLTRIMCIETSIKHLKLKTDLPRLFERLWDEGFHRNSLSGSGGEF